MEASVLEATVTRFNQFAEKGEDPDFQRGQAAYDKMYGDPRQEPKPLFAANRKGPFYAMPIYPGDIGTNGGLLTNENAQVIGKDDAPDCWPICGWE